MSMDRIENTSVLTLEGIEEEDGEKRANPMAPPAVAFFGNHNSNIA